MSSQQAAEIQVVLEGVPLPATKQELLAYARREDEAAAQALQSLPDRKYHSIDDVGEALSSVKPGSPEPGVALPREESGDPPGGEAYLDPSEEPGWVRPSDPAATPPQQVLEQQAEALKQQQKRQAELG